MNLDNLPLENKSKESKIIDRVLQIAKMEEPEKAIRKIQGYLGGYFWIQEIKNILASLYQKEGNKVEAGKHLYFKENLTEEEVDCINAFKQSHGNSSSQILRQLIGHFYKSPESQPLYRNQITRINLIKEVEKVDGIIPKFAWNSYNHLIKK